MEINKNIFLKNNKIECYGKFIILLKDIDNKYISLNSSEFFNYFNILNDKDDKDNKDNKDDKDNKDNKDDKVNILINEENLKNNDDSNSDSNSNSEVNDLIESELEYELYCYSSDNE